MALKNLIQGGKYWTKLLFLQSKAHTKNKIASQIRNLGSKNKMESKCLLSRNQAETVFSALPTHSHSHQKRDSQLRCLQTLKGLRLIKIGDLYNNKVKKEAAKVKIKGTVKSALVFPHHKYYFSQLQLLDFVDFEGSHQRLSNTQSFHFKSLNSFPLVFLSKNNTQPNYPWTKGPNLGSTPFQEMSISRSFLYLLLLLGHVHPIRREDKTI